MNGIQVGWSCDHGSIEIDPDIGRNFDAQRGIFEELGCVVEGCDLDVTGLMDGHYDVLAYQRVAAEVESAVGRGLDAGLEEKYHWYRGLTGERRWLQKRGASGCGGISARPLRDTMC